MSRSRPEARQLGTRTVVALVITTLAHAAVVAGAEPDERLPGKVTTIRRLQLAKFVASTTPGYHLPGLANNPTVHGGTLRVFDMAGGAGADTYSLPAIGWRGLGSPAGATGFKYTGTGSGSDPCRTVLIKPTLVKAVCKGMGVMVNPPFQGDVGIVLSVGNDPKRLCARFGGTTVRNQAGLLIRRNAPAPGTCPGSPTTSTTSTTTSSTTSSSTTSTSTSTTTSTTVPRCCTGERIMLLSSAGTLNTDTVPSYPVPPGVMLTLDSSVGGAFLPECAHAVVVPAGGFSVPNFDFPAYNACGSITPLGCEVGSGDGAGRLWDGNGAPGLAMTNVSSTADTSDGVCNPAGQPCNISSGGAGANTLGNVDTTHTASASGGVRFAVDIRTHWLIWSDHSCSPYYNPGCCVGATYGDDTLANGEIMEWQGDALLSLTTNVATGQFADQNGDGCSRAGSGFSIPGPSGPKTLIGTAATGPCCTTDQAIRLVAVGTTFTGSNPFFDLGYEMTIPMTVSSCGTPPHGSCTVTTDPCLQ